MRKHGAQAWLVNTGWTGGPYGIGSRIKLGLHARDHRRDPLRRAVDGGDDRGSDLRPAGPDQLPGVPAELLQPRNTWADKAAYDAQAKKLAKLFSENFKKYEAQASAEVRAGGPKV